MFFSGNEHTLPAETLVTNTMIRNAHNAVRHGYVANDAMETRESAVYGILYNYLRHGEGDVAIITELRRLYPDTADEAELSYYEWVHDI